MGARASVFANDGKSRSFVGMIPDGSRVTRRVPRFAVVTAFIGGVAALAACSLLNPLDGYSGGSAPDSEADTLAQVDASDAAVPPDAPTAPCVGTRPPERADGGSAGGTITIINALATFEFGDVADLQKPNTKGIDLDRTCTCPGPRSCKPVQGAGVCDFPNGVDNAAGGFFLSLLSVLGREANETAKIQRGEHGLLVRMKNYNGLPDDDDVEVAIFNSFGLDTSSDGGVDASVPAVPKFDGQDRWTIDAKSLLGGTAYLPNIVDTRGYVRDGVVVAQVSNAIRIGPYTVPIVGGVLMAHLVKIGDSFGVDDGVLSGRANARELLTSLESVPNPLDNSKYLCGTDVVFTNLRDRFCQTLDLPTDQSVDGKDAPCDAASFSVRFTSSPAILGRVVDNGAPKKPCGDSWVASCPVP